MKTIYVCSPFRGNRKGNIRRAKKYSRWVYRLGHIPICVHIYLEQATGLDERKGNREELLKLGREFVKICDEVWVFGNVSEGMQLEIGVAKEFGKKIRKINDCEKIIRLEEF